MLIVDAQVHIWANNKPANPNHRQVTTFSKEDPGVPLSLTLAPR